MEDVTFSNEGIQFKDYPVTPASIFPDGIVSWSEIKETDPDYWPPELRLYSGEILFISAEIREAFAVACIRNKIPFVKRQDVWGNLLEPFLDTEFPEDEQQRTQERLQECGFTEDEIKAIRKRAGKFVAPYNFYVWEWVHLGLLDLFTACGLTTNRRMRFFNASWRPKAKKKMYWWAIDIANRSR